MNRVGWSISKYLIWAIAPYLGFAWLLLSVILFVQQAGRFSDIYFSLNIPFGLIWQLSIALIPNVVAFTCPMAVLVGTIIGLTRMQEDSELIAIRAAGVGKFQIAIPIVILGSLLSIFAFFINLKGVPLAASLVQNIALQSAVKKLESPIEPGDFNSEVSRYTIFVKDGDVLNGRWNNIFIYDHDPDTGDIRLITSKNGRIDFTDQRSELVLEDATVATIPKDPGKGKFATENIGEVRFGVRTKRSELIEKLSAQNGSTQDLGFGSPIKAGEKPNEQELIEAQLLWQRRIVLSVTPLIFCLLGTAMVLRFNRRGRGFGIFLSLIGLIAYYFAVFIGEQAVRTGRLPIVFAGIVPILASALAILLLLRSDKSQFGSKVNSAWAGIWRSIKPKERKLQMRNLFVDVTTGLRDFDIATNLFRYFVLALSFLTAIFLIFTAFELWRFAGTMNNGFSMLSKYLAFLLPYVYLQLAPSAAMIATIATYVIKSRQNEMVTWTSAGQSVYRLITPCLLIMLTFGAFNFLIQEFVAPYSNRMQDNMRTSIRTGKIANENKNYWVADGNRIFSFYVDNEGSETGEVRFFEPHQNSPDKDSSDNESGITFHSRIGKSSGIVPFTGHEGLSISNGLGNRVRPASLFSHNFSSLLSYGASDKEKQIPGINGTYVRDLNIYEFVNNTGKLQTMYQVPEAVWTRGNILFTERAQRYTLSDGKMILDTLEGGQIPVVDDPFVISFSKPSQMKIGELKDRIDSSISESVKRNYSVALERRYTILFLPFVIAFFTAPFSLSLSRSGKALTVGYAVGMWLFYTGVTSVFEQFGLNGSLSPALAVWSPLAIFFIIGVVLMSRIKT